MRRVIVILTMLATAGCSLERPRRVLTPPASAAALDKRSPYLKAHLRDGSVWVLGQWVVDEAAGTVTGTGERRSPARERVEQRAVTLPLASVALFETNVVQRSPAVASLAVVTGISVAMTGYCAANPKACFGSCPTFYVADGEHEVLQAEGFSDSIAPSLERRDLDALYAARPARRELQVRMTNEALETHVVRYVRLQAARRPEGGRVVADEAGHLWQATGLAAPTSCRAAEGDCLDRVREFDGRERQSGSDPTDLAAREWMDLEFDSDPAGPTGLVVVSRQTLLSTFLLYQGLAYMGSSAGAWLARLERGDDGVLSRARGLREALGGIEVLVPDARGGWKAAGELHETGPLARDVKVVPLPAMRRRPLKVRLRLTKGHWRIDYLALARLGRTVQPLPLEPQRIVRDGEEITMPPRGLTTLPGDAYTFTYALPPEPDGYELFLDTRGYYLEWMRDEWMAEENPARVALLFRDPRRALRVLAPAFKAQEAGMEDLFWRSRYVRP